MGIWNLLLIDPLIRVEFVGLYYVGQSSRLAEAPVGQLIDGFGSTYAIEIDERPRIEEAVRSCPVSALMIEDE